MKKHIGYPLTDGKPAAGLGADKGALLEVELEEGVVEAAEEVIGVEHVGAGGFGEVGVTEGFGGGGEGGPVDLGEHVLEEVGVEVDLLLHHFYDFDLEREAVCHPLDVR